MCAKDKKKKKKKEKKDKEKIYGPRVGLYDDEMEFRHGRFGKVRIVGDDYEFIEEGKKLEMNRDDMFGVEFKLACNTDQSLIVEIEVEHPDDFEEDRKMNVVTNKPFILAQGFPEEKDMLNGEWLLKVDAHNVDGFDVIGEVSQTFKLKCNKPVLDPVTDENIKAIESLYGTQLNEDFKGYLKEHNGLVPQWWKDDELVSQQRQDDFEDTLEMVRGTLPIMFSEDEKGLADVCELFGVNQIGRYRDMMNPEVSEQFYNKAFGPMFYPVGRDYAGNIMVQIADGQNRGKLAMLDHEPYHGGMDQLVGAGGNADQVIDQCVSSGYMAVYDITLQDFLSRHLDNKEKNIKKLQDFMTGEGAVQDEIFASMGLAAKVDSIDEAEIKKVGSFEKGDNGSFELKEKGKKLELAQSDYFGIQYKLKSKSDDLQNAVCQIEKPSGDKVNSEVQVKPNENTVLAVSGTELGGLEKGEYKFSVKFPDNMFLEKLKKTIKVKVN